ncbi:MAG: hypothetical protein LH630_05370 [Actinomycetia bacterium]|nr:hypothetical protein [Actinomycetes bacterium]
MTDERLTRTRAAFTYVALAATILFVSACATDPSPAAQPPPGEASSLPAEVTTDPDAPVVEPSAGFSDKETDKTNQSGWWMTSPRGTVEVRGKPSVAAVVTFSLVPSPCGPAEATVDGKRFSFSGHTPTTVRVPLDSAGDGSFDIRVSTPLCKPKKEKRTLYMMVYNPKATLNPS